MAGSAADGPNRSLHLDSCQLFTDSLGTPFLFWLGDTASAVTFSCSLLNAQKAGPQAKLDLHAGQVALVQSYLNLPALLVLTTEKALTLSQNTFNRVQFDLVGKFTGVYAFTRNLFAHPPAISRLAVGGAHPWVMTMGLFHSGTASQNARFST